MLPDDVFSSRTFLKLGAEIHRAHVKWQGRIQTHYTWFLRNVPLLELLQALVLKAPPRQRWRVISIGCSTGPELYSILWYLRSARPDMEISGVGADIREHVVAKARDATYSLHDDEAIRLSDAKLEALFDHVDDGIRVKEWIRKDTRWVVADALDPQLPDELGLADLLVANNFIGAMPDDVAERCLENLIRLVSPSGYFAVNGELDLKTRFVRKHDLAPVDDRIEAVHFGDTGRPGWPWGYHASEPLDKQRSDWKIRYAVVFTLPRRPC
jgi:chemotaxis protein methyltransferase CheR